MSGGHWNYEQHQMESLLKDVARDPKVKERFPSLAQRINTLADALGQIVHDLDWDFSGDSEIVDDRSFEKLVLEMLNEDV
jgi:hypothetical protein